MFRIRSFFKELEPTRQMSEAFRNCIFLALSGGFQDAYTYFTRDGVFANAQTGNVVLMSTNFMTGKWGEGLKYLFPILRSLSVKPHNNIRCSFCHRYVTCPRFDRRYLYT